MAKTITTSISLTTGQMILITFDGFDPNNDVAKSETILTCPQHIEVCCDEHHAALRLDGELKLYITDPSQIDTINGDALTNLSDVATFLFNAL